MFPPVASLSPKPSRSRARTGSAPAKSDFLPSAVERQLVVRSNGRPAISPFRRRFFIYGDHPAFDRNIAAGDEVAEYAAHHVARRADPLRDLLLRDLVGNDELAVLFDGHLQEKTGDPPIDVEQGQGLHAIGREAP